MSPQLGWIEFITESLNRIIYGNRNNTTLTREIYLPEEIISEILSRLPVKSILRSKSVCKLWSSVTSDPEFIHKHMMRTTQTICAREVGNGHYIRSMSRGLILERTSPTSNYRLRNPTTRKVFDLPHSDDDNNGFYHLMQLCYASEMRTFKVAFPSLKGKNGNDCFKILSVGVDEKWRTIDFPLTSSEPTKGADPDTAIEADVYVVFVRPRSGVHGEPFIVCMEIESEKMWRNNIPKHFVEDLIKGAIINWCGRPSLAGMRRSNMGMLCVLVLEDYKKGKWAESAIDIDLSTMLQYYNPNLIFEDDDNARGCVAFDIVTKVAMEPKTSEGQLRGQPSLVVDFKGGMMKTCDDYKSLIDAYTLLFFFPPHFYH